MSTRTALVAGIVLLTAGAVRAAPTAITKGKVVVSCALPKPTLPDADFVMAPPRIDVTIDFGANRAVVSSNNGAGGSSGPVQLDLADSNHQSAKALINPRAGWMAILVTTVDAKTSDLYEVKLYLQRPSKTAPYRVLEVRNGGYNPVSGMAYGYLDLDIFIGKTCEVAVSGQ